MAVIELEDLPVTDRVEVLREHMLNARVPLELRPFENAVIRVRSRAAQLGGVHLLSTRASGAQAVRTPRLARDCTEPSLIVGVLAAGTTVVRQHGRSAHLRPGDVVVLATDSAYSIDFDGGTLRHSFQIARSAVGLPDALIETQLARPFSAAHPLAGVLSDHLRRLAAASSALSSVDRLATERPALELVRAMLAAGRDDRVGRAAAADSLGARMLAYMQSHLADRALSPATIAAAHNVSERQLYLVLGRIEIAPGEWIRQARTDAAARDLADPSARRDSVSTIAHRSGFADHPHFVRVFRARFGMTPTDWRRMHPEE